MYKEENQCPVCGSKGLQKKVITETFEYKDKSFCYPNYIIYECPSCGEAVVDKKTLKESGRAIRDFYRQVDGLLTAKEIRKIRESKLNLTQDEASALLGGGKKSFARYENSEIIQSTALDNLLRILDDDPSKLIIISNKNKIQKKSVVIPLHLKYDFVKKIDQINTSPDEEYYSSNNNKVACYG
jgi:HTH-type transcriptional regulator / antitoxin MqsA